MSALHKLAGVFTIAKVHKVENKLSNMFIKVLMITSVLLIISLAGLAIKILFKKNGRFPNTHVGSNAEMRKRGITCAKRTDIGCNPVDSSGTCACDLH